MEPISKLIHTSMDGLGPITELVVFPRPEFLIGPPALDHIKSAALMRLEDATIWMLVLEKEGWTDERLRAAGACLARVSNHAFTKRSVESLLRKELGVRSLSMAPPPVRRIDDRLWEIEKVAFCWVRGPAATRSGGRIPEAGLAQAEWTARAQLRHGLGEALRDFHRLMDPEALPIATTGPRFDLRVYNYLVHSQYQRYRLQFAGTFPSLLLTAVVAEPASSGEDLRAFVDTGAPLIKGLAARWEVRPGVVRHLVGRDWGIVGLQWARDARGLMVALNALHPQDLPRDDPAEWEEFNRVVATGQRLFLRPVWESAAALKWLRVCVRLSRRGDRQTLDRWLPRWNDLEQITRFRAALAGTVREEISAARATTRDGDDKVITEAVDRIVLQVADQGLRDVATLFAEELTRTRAGDRVRQMRAREILMPLIPEDYVSTDGATRVTALTTDRELRTHGSRMRNCLRSMSPSAVARQGPIGTVFIVGLYDVTSGKALSTAEIRAVAAYGGTDYRLITEQHTASANRPPSRRCVDALQEFLCHCRTAEVRAHLGKQWGELRRLGSRHDGQAVHAPRALRNTLGEQVYEGLLESVSAGLRG
ncbi:hypothetical protein [Lentisalinibacter salinarum]|uniref:hypothetical protein n=1 Tax=Lentisalinibacter salinarum TaxID=2992239 RepID=UPI00386B2C1A